MFPLNLGQHETREEVMSLLCQSYRRKTFNLVYLEMLALGTQLLCYEEAEGTCKFLVKNLR